MCVYGGGTWAIACLLLLSYKVAESIGSALLVARAQGDLVEEAPPRLNLLAFAALEGCVQVAARGALGGERRDGMCARNALEAEAAQVVDVQSLRPQPLVCTHTPQEMFFSKLWSEGGFGNRRSFPLT